MWNEQTIAQELHRAAVRHNLSDAQERKILEVIRCEDPTLNPAAQSGYYKNGIREQSYGLAQWNIPSGNLKEDGTLITKEDATNPVTSIDLIAWYFSKGEQDKWSCYRKLYGV